MAPSANGPPLLAALALFGAFGCERGDGGHDVPPARAVVRAAAPSADPAQERALETLRTEETALRARTDFARLPPSSRSFGANPYAVTTLPGASVRPGDPLFASVTRGDSELVLLSRDARVLSRVSAPISPTALAALPDGRVFVVGEIEPRIARYRLSGSRPLADGDIPLPDALSLRSLVADDRGLFAGDFWGDRLYSMLLGPEPHETVVMSQPLCAGPIHLALTEHFLGAVCLFDHSVALFERAKNGLLAREIKRIDHDGPIWGFSLLERGDELFVATGGVEDHPLDRRDKAFGYVDSFAYLYRIDAERRLERLFALNTSELGVVTPKVTRLSLTGPTLSLAIVGYASDSWLDVAWTDASFGDVAGPTVRARHDGVPGCSDTAFADGRVLCANPLLDAWVELGAGSLADSEPRRVSVHPARSPAASDPSPAERLGEALFFTTLMAPDATSAGRRSRFTCETCHFEGGTDGRVHHSGRGDVRVSTRPLLGLFNGGPHFSRAHDADLTSVSHNEFSVANRGNPVDPWFSLPRSRFPWLSELGVTEDSVDALELRRDLLVFLARFSHAENPLAVRRPPPRHFTDDERRGAEIFRERCARCHAARLIARDETKEIPFERWEALVLSPEGPIVWSNGEYAKTGVVPYVDPKGTRIPSLRRLYLKRPYLTNGSAATLDALLSAARFSDTAFLHAPSDETKANGSFTSKERRELVALLQIL